MSKSAAAFAVLDAVDPTLKTLTTTGVISGSSMSNP